MAVPQLLVLLAIGFVGAVTGSVAGATSLVTVPVMILLGMDATTAVATNMLAVTCLSAGAALRFGRNRLIIRHPTLGLTIGAIPGSIAGALLASTMSPSTLHKLISIAVVLGLGLVAVQPRFGQTERAPSRGRQIVGQIAMALWAIYGGLFAGGYTTVLTAACVLLFGTTLLEAVALTKVVNLASSGAATIVFAVRGQIDWKVGLLLSAIMALGGWLGATLAIEKGTQWIRWVFFCVILALAIQMLLKAFA